MSSTTIETFPNPRPERDFEIAISCPEFTSVCPKTGLPDFGEIRITYVPDGRCIELKSLKYYMIEFRNRGIFFEHVTNQILDDLVAAIEPRRMTVVGDFSVRGGIKTVVTATYSNPEIYNGEFTIENDGMRNAGPALSIVNSHCKLHGCDQRSD